MKHLSGNSVRFLLISVCTLLAAAALLLFPMSAADGARRGIG